MTQKRQKEQEVRIADDFLKSAKLLNPDVKSLAQFAGIEQDPTTNQCLDNMCPDVVAVRPSGNIGIELTAYSANDDENVLSSSQRKVHEFVRDHLQASPPDLHGFYISWRPNLTDVLPKNKVQVFAEELLNFAKAKNSEVPLEIGDERQYPEYLAPPNTKPFGGWPVLKQYAKSVRVRRPEHLSHLKVSVNIGGNTSSRGTSVEGLYQTIKKKSSKLAGAYWKNMEEIWLLIHAVRSPIASDIYPLFPHEIERLLGSNAAAEAARCDFARVVLWDGIDGGYVDLKTHEYVPVVT